MTNNIYPAKAIITRSQREQLLLQRSRLIWFTGLSGSGKSTLAVRLEAELHQSGYKTYLLDGDHIRSGLNKDLFFSREDRAENIRRVGEVSKLFTDAGLIVLSAFISPFHTDRQKVKEIVGTDDYIEVFVDAPLAVCEMRDVKGLYKKARSGELKDFTGIDSPYEKPSRPDIHIQTHLSDINECVTLLLDFITPLVSCKQISNIV
jgi:adenylyl-sulfate kinase